VLLNNITFYIFTVLDVLLTAYHRYCVYKLQFLHLYSQFYYSRI